jgi:lipopolysaccharide export system protein LptA
MTSWQKRLRLGIAVLGIAFAAFVYWSTATRRAFTPAPTVERLDPKAALEATAAKSLQFRGKDRSWDIAWSRLLTYSDGSARAFDVVITIYRPENRVVTITAKEALNGPNEVRRQLMGEVKLATSSGFTLFTDEATVDENSGVTRVPGPLTFARGGMTGSGLGGTYEEATDVLGIESQVKVSVKDKSVRQTMEASAGSATMERLQDVVLLDSPVHLLRDGQVIDTDHARVALAEGQEVITLLQLRGRSSVKGGDGPLESMRANEIDLDYRDDGKTVERTTLRGGASVTMAADEQTSGRQMSGENLDLQLAADGSLTSLEGGGMVAFEIPAVGRNLGRRIRAGRLSAVGEPGRGLVAARFRQNVEYREQGSDAPSREARSQALSLQLDGDAVTSAQFSEGVTFDEQGLRATAAEATYQPAKGLLSLAGMKGAGEPTVTDERIRVEARSIEVTLDGHGMAARDNVRTVLRGKAASPRGGPPAQNGRLPGLFKEEDPVSVSAGRLDYGGQAGRAVYTGSATLLQGETTIRGNVISIDQEKGDLVVTGAARSTLPLDGGKADGQGDEIRYDEAGRQVTYSMTSLTPTSVGSGTPTGKASPPSRPRVARLNGPQGDLRAQRIVIVLARDGNEVDRLEGYDNVTLVQGDRTAVGARLTYDAGEESYVMSGRGATPVTIRVTIRGSCRETTGETLTFFKSNDSISVGGDETGRTEDKPCPAAPAR